MFFLFCHPQHPTVLLLPIPAPYGPPSAKRKTECKELGGGGGGGASRQFCCNLEYLDVIDVIFGQYRIISCQEKNPDQKILFYHGEILILVFEVDIWGGGGIWILLRVY